VSWAETHEIQDPEEKPEQVAWGENQENLSLIEEQEPVAWVETRESESWVETPKEPESWIERDLEEMPQESGPLMFGATSATPSSADYQSEQDVEDDFPVFGSERDIRVVDDRFLDEEVEVDTLDTFVQEATEIKEGEENDEADAAVQLWFDQGNLE
jgi:hypothetical protein